MGLDSHLMLAISEMFGNFSEEAGNRLNLHLPRLETSHLLVSLLMELHVGEKAMNIYLLQIRNHFQLFPFCKVSKNFLLDFPLFGYIVLKESCPR